MNPKITIVLPVYKVEEYIEDCVKSIANQSFKDFELLIIDDSTPDRSVEIAKKVLEGSEVNYYVIKKENGGLASARNVGIDNSNGEYLCFVDSDDVLHPDYLKTLFDDANNNDCTMAIANFKAVNADNKFCFDTSNEIGVLVDKKSFLKKVLKRKIFNYFGCFLIKRDYLIKQNLRFDETVFFGVDQAYMWRLMVNVPAYTYNKKKIYNYFDRPGSIMTGTKIQKMLTGLPSLVKCSKELQNNCYFDSKHIVTKWKISALHTISKQNSYGEYLYALKKLKPNFIDCLLYPDFRINCIGLLFISNRMSYAFLKKH